MRGVAREELSVRERGHVSATLRCWFVRFHTKILGELNRLSFVKVDICLTSRSTDTDAALGAHRLTFGRKIHYANLLRSHFVNLFNRSGNLCLRRARRNTKGIDTLFSHNKSLLREPRGADDIVRDSTGRYLRTSDMFLRICLHRFVFLIYFFSSKECHK